jgi:hypothetical protein
MSPRIESGQIWWLPMRALERGISQFPFDRWVLVLRQYRE